MSTWTGLTNATKNTEKWVLSETKENSEHTPQHQLAHKKDRNRHLVCLKPAQGLSGRLMLLWPTRTLTARELRPCFRSQGCYHVTRFEFFRVKFPGRLHRNIKSYFLPYLVGCQQWRTFLAPNPEQTVPFGRRWRQTHGGRGQWPNVNHMLVSPPNAGSYSNAAQRKILVMIIMRKLIECF